MIKKSLLLFIALALTACSTVGTPMPTDTPVLTETPPPTSTLTPTAVPSPIVTATPEFTFGDISFLVVLDGFTVLVPFPYVHRKENNVLLIANEKRTLTLSFTSDIYDGTPLTGFIHSYLESLERRGGSFEMSQPEAVIIDEVEGTVIEFHGRFGGAPVQGGAVAVAPRPEFVLFGLAMSNLDEDPSLWENDHRAVFKAFLGVIDFVDTTSSCRISTDATYGYAESNPIKVGGDMFNGPSREHAYLDHLRGPNGEVLSYERQGSLPGKDAILDMYRITGPGIDKVLYLDMYNYSPPMAPVGFTCLGDFPLSQP